MKYQVDTYEWSGQKKQIERKRTAALRAAKQMHNYCKDNCDSFCPFSSRGLCPLSSHPFEWGSVIEEAKKECE